MKKPAKLPAAGAVAPSNEAPQGQGGLLVPPGGIVEIQHTDAGQIVVRTVAPVPKTAEEAAAPYYGGGTWGGVTTVSRPTIAARREETVTVAKILQKQAHDIFQTAVEMGLSGRELVEMISAQSRPFVEDEIRESYATPEEGLQALLQAEGGCVDTNEARKLYNPPRGVSRQAMSDKARDQELIAYRTAGGAYRFPRWQFRPEGGVLAGLAEILAALREAQPGAGPLAPFAFFLQAEPLLDGRTPLEALRAGHAAAVLEAAGAQRV